MYLKDRVQTIIDERAEDSWKIDELNTLLYRVNRSINDNTTAIESVKQHISGMVDKHEIESWKQLLDANMRDKQVLIEHKECILQAIHAVKTATKGEQLDLFI